MVDILKRPEVRKERFCNAIKRRYQRVFVKESKARERLMAILRNGETINFDLNAVNNKAVITYLQRCKDLNIDPYDLLPIESYKENRKENVLENRLLAYYCDLNRSGRERVMELLDDIHSLEKYRRI